MNNLFYDMKYMEILGSELQGFHQSSRNQWNFRCPICGDSATNKSKKRAYLGINKESLMFHCFNCEASMTFGSLLKEVDNDLYQAYRKEIFRDKIAEEEKYKKRIRKEMFSQKTKIKTQKTLNNRRTNNENSRRILEQSIGNDENEEILSELSEEGKSYCTKRCIPERQFNRIKWTWNFRKLISKSFKTEYELEKLPEDSGLIFVLTDKNGNFGGFQRRSINPQCLKSQRFLICSEKDQELFFGMEYLNWEKQIFVVEGPIDSLFLPNCIATLNSSIWRANIPNAIYFSDQEPRNSQVVKQIEKTINKGYKTVLLPEEFYGMDVNDIILNYGNSIDLIKLFNENTYSGLSARVKLSSWRKDK